MRKITARRIFIFLLTISLALTFHLSGIAAAGALTVKSVSLTNSLPSASSNITIAFTTANSSTLDQIDFQFATTPSGALTSPTGLGIGAATLNTITGAGAGWSIAGTSSGDLQIATAAAGAAANGPVSVTFNSITLPAISSCNPVSNNSSGTCYIRITTETGSGTVVDQGSASFTMIASTTATATVDPSLTLTIGGVASGTTTNGTPATTATSTYNTLPFGNIAAGQSAVVAQTITVVTNALSGYTVKMAMTTPMTGTSLKLLYPFEPAGATWSTPVVWTDPTGSVTGTTAASEVSTTASFLGANTTNTNVTGWASGSGKYGPVNNPGNGGNIVDQSSGPQQNVSQTVTYRLSTDVYQPADTYTGTLQYNAVATY